MKKSTVSVSERALLQRINRRLREDDQVVKKARGPRAQQEVGDYFTLSISGNYIIEKETSLEEVGKESGALRPWERLAQ